MITNIKVHPITMEGFKSSHYFLTANGIDIPVERITKYTSAVINYARLDYDGEIPLNFELKVEGEIGENYSISPIRENIQGTVNKDTLSFTISKPQYMVIRMNDKEDLFILVDAFEENPPKPCECGVKSILSYEGVDHTGKKDSSETINRAMKEISQSEVFHTLYFPAGQYLSKQINMQSNVTVYLEAGALIHATDQSEDYPDGGLFCFINIENAKLAGRGQLEGNGRILRASGSVHNISMDRSKNCVIDGITERDSAFWGNHIERSDNIEFKNFKIINYRPAIGMNNTDGLNFDCSKNCSLDNGFLYTGDDNCVVKGTVANTEYNPSNIFFHNFIGYSNSAACKIGTETLTDSMTDIEFKNVDIVSCDRALVITAYDNSTIENIKFEGIYVEDIAQQGIGAEASQLIEFVITNDSWRVCEGKCVVNHVLCKDIYSFTDIKTFPIVINGRTEQYRFNHINFNNLNIQNNQILKLSDGNFNINEHVYNLSYQK